MEFVSVCVRGGDGLCERALCMVKRRKREGKWAAYEAGIIKPRVLKGHMDVVSALAVKICSASWDKTIRVWSGVHGTHLQTLKGHPWLITSLAVELDGKIYSGSLDRTIRVWSGRDGTHLQTLKGHTHTVRALVVGLDGKIYSGSYDTTIRVWSGVDGSHLQTLEGPTAVMSVLSQ